MNIFGKDTDAPQDQAQPTSPLNGYHFDPPPQMVYPTGSAEDVAQEEAKIQSSLMAGGAITGGASMPTSSQPNSALHEQPGNNDMPTIGPPSVA